MPKNVFDLIFFSCTRLSDTVAVFGYIGCGLNLVALFLTIWFYPIDFSKYQKEPSKTDIEAVKDTELEDKPRLTGEPVQTLSETEKPSLNMAEKP